MQKFKVLGMSCAACVARVEKAVKSVENSAPVSVNLLTGDLSVGDNADSEKIKAAVISAGYKIAENEEKDSETNEFGLLKKRLFSSIVILLVLMYFSMFHEMFGAPLPGFIANRNALLGAIQFCLAAAVCVINKKFFTSGIKSVIHKAPNMDTLVALGAATAFIYSSYLVADMFFAATKHHLYFESSAMILTLVTVGKTLEAKAKGRSTDAIKQLKEMAPKTASVIKDGKEITVSADLIMPGDVFIVRPGESIPADGVCVSGSAAVDESSVTGESMPVTKSEGSEVKSGCILLGGSITCRATNTAKDSTFSKIIKTVSEATASKAPIARLADKVAGVFVPVVMSIAAVTFAAWLILGRTLEFSLARAIAVLVISCPCALGLATPVAIMVSSGVGAKHGVLYKTAESLENCGRVKTVILDKTGTITQGSPEITDILCDNKQEFLSLAAGIEKFSSHPLSHAVCAYCEKQGVDPFTVTDFKEIAGKGVTAKYNGKTLFGGSLAAAKEICEISSDTVNFANKVSIEGKTPLIFVLDGVFFGALAAADRVKADSFAAIKDLKRMKIKTVMLTGDNETTAKRIADEVGITEVIAGVLPDEKAKAVEKYKSSSTVAMVGDGINDAPALTVADVGIAIGGGKDIASHAADVVLMKNSLAGVSAALSLGRKTLLNIKENLFWAFIYNLIGIPAAAGLLGFSLDPMFGAAAMSVSSVCVVLNALRLNAFKSKINTMTEEDGMKTVIKVSGMSCEHCEARVENALVKLEGVKSAKANHKKCEVALKLFSEVNADLLKETVENEGYKFEGIKE